MRRVTWALVALVLGMLPGLGRAQLAPSPWPSYGGDVRNTHRSTRNGPRGDVRMLWEYACGSMVAYQPVVAADGTILFAAGELVALTPSGQLRWRESSGPISCWPAVDAAGRVLSASWVNGYTGGRRLAARYVTDGQVAWTTPLATSAYLQSGPTVAPDGTVYMGHQEFEMYAFSPAGQLQWTGAGGGYLVTPAVAPNGNIITGSGWSIQATSPTGQSLWTHPAAGNVASAAVAADGTIYAGSMPDTVGGRGVLYALSPTGQLLWDFDGVGASPSIGPDGTIYATESHREYGPGGPPDAWDTGMLYAINPDGTEKWRYEIGNQGEQSVASEGVAVDADGNVYATNAQGRLISLDAQGQLRWTLDLAPATTEDIYPTMPVIGADGVLYVGTGRGRSMVAVVPEPATLALLGMGAIGLLGRRRVRKRGLGGARTVQAQAQAHALT